MKYNSFFNSKNEYESLKSNQQTKLEDLDTTEVFLSWRLGFLTSDLKTGWFT